MIWKDCLGAFLRVTYIGSISKQGYLFRPGVFLAWVWVACLIIALSS